MEDTAYERGQEVRRQLGFVGSDPDERSGVFRDFLEFGTRYAFGEVWARPGLDLQTRSCVTIAILTALARPDYLAIHLKIGLENGLSPEEMREVIFHTAVYAGMPAAAQAMRVADTVLGK
jgi:alkylhydroperoxidase/carboxymuconolactone decarboxylase family protein YurZ